MNICGRANCSCALAQHWVLVLETNSTINFTISNGSIQTKLLTSKAIAAASTDLLNTIVFFLWIIYNVLSIHTKRSECWATAKFRLNRWVHLLQSSNTFECTNGILAKKINIYRLLFVIRSYLHVCRLNIEQFTEFSVESDVSWVFRTHNELKSYCGHVCGR